MFIIAIALLLALFVSLARKILEVIIPRHCKDVNDQVVVITGGGKGLGRQLVLAFAQRKCKIAVVDLDYDSAVETAKMVSTTAKAYKADVSNLTEIEALKTEIESDLGPVDIVVNNAGLLFENNLITEDPKYLQKLIDVNLMALLWTTRTFLPGMIERKRGHIVAISSVFGCIGLVTSPTYCASKFGVRGFMESLELDLNFRKHSRYIKTSTVFPYFISTNEEVVSSYQSGTKFKVAMLKPNKAAEEIVTRVLKEDEIIVLPNFLVHLLYQVTLPLWIKRFIYNYGMRSSFEQTRVK